MRIVRLITSIRPVHGGPSRHVARTSAVLAERGHDVVIVCADDPEAIADVDVGAAAVVAVGAGRTPLAIQPSLLPAVVRACEQASCLVVHGLWQFPTVAALHAHRRTGVPIVVLPHGMLDPWISRRTTVRRVVRGAQYRALEGRLLDRARAVVFTAESERTEADRAWPIGGPQHVIRYGTEDPRDVGIEPRLTASTGRATFGYLGRYHQKKRIDLLIAALAEEGLEHATLAVMGPDGHEQDEVRALARAGGVEDRVSFLPPTFDAGRFDFLGSVDWLVLPSMQENFAQAASEALSMGTPVILSDRVAIADEVASAGAGLICRPDLPSLAVAMRRAVGEVDAGRRTAARSCFDDRFHIDRCVDDLEALFSAR